MKGNGRVARMLAVAMCTLLVAGLAVSVSLAQGPYEGPVARVSIEPSLISWEPLVADGGLMLTIRGPGDFYWQKEYGSGAVPTLQAQDDGGNLLSDGVYKFELRLYTPKREASITSDETLRGLEPSKVDDGPRTQSGSFSILQGSFTSPLTEEGGAELNKVGLLDHVILDDLIVDGSLCVGFDCIDGESFGYQTIRLKENNLRIEFEDTSNTASFPTVDWRILINDTANGGMSYFAVQDKTAGRTPFKIESNAPSNSLYVDDGGRIGNGTSSPSTEIHTVDGDTPTLRLQQDGSSGFSPQTWDVAGNETNFFVRDVSNGSTLPFRIFPGAPSSSLFVHGSGDIGIGTSSPEEALHVQRDDGTAVLLVKDTTTTTGTRTLLRLVNNGLPRMSFKNNNADVTWNFGMMSGNHFSISLIGSGDYEFELDDTGNLDILGSLNEGSDANSKESFQPVDDAQILASLRALPLTTWSFKRDDPSVRHLGPTAQDFRKAFGLGKDELHISSLDANGVALAAIQELSNLSQEQAARIDELESQVATLEARMAALEKIVAAADSK